MTSTCSWGTPLSHCSLLGHEHRYQLVQNYYGRVLGWHRSVREDQRDDLLGLAFLCIRYLRTLKYQTITHSTHCSTSCHRRTFSQVTYPHFSTYLPLNFDHVLLLLILPVSLPRSDISPFFKHPVLVRLTILSLAIFLVSPWI